MTTSKGYTVHATDERSYIRLYKDVGRPNDFVQVEAALPTAYDDVEQEAARIWEWAMSPDGSAEPPPT